MRQEQQRDREAKHIQAGLVRGFSVGLDQEVRLDEILAMKVPQRTRQILMSEDSRALRTSESTPYSSSSLVPPRLLISRTTVSLPGPRNGRYDLSGSVVEVMSSSSCGMSVLRGGTGVQG
jgi:hypothetical protein